MSIDQHVASLSFLQFHQAALLLPVEPKSFSVRDVVAFRRRCRMMALYQVELLLTLLIQPLEPEPVTRFIPAMYGGGRDKERAEKAEGGGNIRSLHDVRSQSRFRGALSCDRYGTHWRATVVPTIRKRTTAPVSKHSIVDRTGLQSGNGSLEPAPEDDTADLLSGMTRCRQGDGKACGSESIPARGLVSGCHTKRLTSAF